MYREVDSRRIWQDSCSESLADNQIWWMSPATGYILLVLQSLSCVWLCNPTDCSTPGSPVLYYLLEFVQIHVHWVSNALQSSLPLPTSPPSTFPRIRVFSSGSVLHIRWPKYWSFSFSISPSNEYLGLISFRIEIPLTLPFNCLTVFPLSVGTRS